MKRVEIELWRIMARAHGWDEYSKDEEEVCRRYGIDNPVTLSSRSETIDELRELTKLVGLKP